jgi:methyl-accepting chemotaxis protein
MRDRESRLSKAPKFSAFAASHRQSPLAPHMENPRIAMSSSFASRFHFKSVKTKLLFWFLLIGIVPLAIVGYLAYDHAHDEMVAESGEELQLLAQETTDKVDRNLFERYGDVQAFAENPLAKGTTAEATQAINFYTQCYGIYDLMIVADADGKVVATNTVDADGKPINSAPLIGQSVRGQPWFEEIISGRIAKGKTYFCEPDFDPAVAQATGSKAFTLNFSAPIVDAQGKVTRVWSNRASFKRIVANIMEGQRKQCKDHGMDSIETQIIAKSGLVLDDHDAAAIQKLNLVESGLEAAKLAATGKCGFAIEKHERRGVDQINGYASSQGALGFPGYGWGALVRQDLSEATAAARDLRNFVLISAVASIAVILALAWWIASAIAKPVVQTATVLDAVATGDLTQRLDINTNDEFGRMAGSLNTAIAASAKTLEDVQIAAQREQELQTERAEQERVRVEEDRRREETERTRKEEEARKEHARVEREREEKAAAATAQREREQAAERELREKVEQLLSVVNSAAEGDLTRAVTVNGEDAVGELASGLRRMLEDLREIITQVVESAAQFTEGSRVVAEGSQSLAANAQTQSSVVEEMTAAISQLNLSIDDVRRNATEADTVAKSTASLAERGGSAVQQSIEAMALIKTSSEKISEIISVISEIASQTNLLALNAAIEAARAGEHGLGFAVVADEVRKLAERSNKAAGEVSSLIRESTQRVEQGATLSNETGRALQQIIEGVQATANRISQIASATVEQSNNAQEVAKAIENVSQGTEQVAAGSEEMASSSEELGAQSAGLRELVQRFKVSSSGSSTTVQPRTNKTAKARESYEHQLAQ